ncbi:mannose-6-phosphate isomerase, class I [Microbacterium rhizomatis]|uniref:mannose-6-phosphate isomerase n=1 Tax=Microbacterium rhizomatis TaxID=1631477 RepID=A0A5J5J4T3_9MICO|nr:mannose-6-phosphate isomerase, class I [Microbacterium rhizomatis]KAA9111217.1 mannose-6-phosphate isomerase, class I [Microbacterium rhizomatis]
MLAPLSNTPRDSAWGSPTLLAQLEGREPTGAPEAEVWFGDHPSSPALVEDGSGRALDAWLADEAGAAGVPARLPFLLKLLAAASTLSIQAHPSKAQAEEGFARENAAGVPRAASGRNYHDDNHKPEMIVALSERFEVLSGLRDLEATRDLLAELGERTDTGQGVAELRDRLGGADARGGADAAEGLASTIGWLLSGDAQHIVDDVIAAASAVSSERFAAELALSRRLAAEYPGDAGVVVALLMNLVTLRRGEAIFVPAGVLHAYQSGLGVEIMAASDNVLRGGLTPKNIDVEELIGVLDATTGPVSLLQPETVAPGVFRYAPPVDDFALVRVESSDDVVEVEISGVAIVLVTSGLVSVSGAKTTDAVTLRPGQALLSSSDESPLRIGGGEAFVAEPGAPADLGESRHADGAA